MKWVKASERLPDVTTPPSQIIVRWYSGNENKHLFADACTANQLKDERELSLHKDPDLQPPGKVIVQGLDLVIRVAMRPGLLHPVHNQRT